ncbi:unnamed protein product [Parnassius mnemosyne]|uniref:Regulatory protein zeste n=1 Tax=Parnassius mnemosyne TaxID=213953 RepID=A0AAV1LAF0_9NEOP
MTNSEDDLMDVKFVNLSDTQENQLSLDMASATNKWSIECNQCSVPITGKYKAKCMACKKYYCDQCVDGPIYFDYICDTCYGVQAKIGVIENRRTDGVSLRKKSEAWEEITSQFNNSNVTQIADTKQLKKMWQNLKTKARDAKTLEAQRKRTGGGSALSDMGPLESQMIAVMPNVLLSINIEIDSDTIATGSTLGLDNDEQMWLPKRVRMSDMEQNNNIEIEFSDDADTKQLKKMWQNLKTKARDAKTLEAQRKRTGGGSALSDMGPLESQMIAVMPNVLLSINIEIDSDTIATGSTLGLDNDEQMWLPKRVRMSDMEQNNNIEIEFSDDVQKKAQSRNRENRKKLLMN